jgi:hypothetical protein
MHFHFLSFLIGFFFGIALVLVSVYLLLKFSIKDDEDIWRRLSQLGFSDD